VADYFSEYKPYEDVLESFLGVIFFGVPNQGIRFEELRHMVEGKRSAEFVHSLLPDNDTEMSAILDALNTDFSRCAGKFRHSTKGGLNILCYYEKDETRVSEVRQCYQIILCTLTIVKRKEVMR
jgi:hypothetical protein